jgi:hypothetical protein
MRTDRTSTSCKIHGKRLAAFRETLEVRTRPRVGFNQDVALDSVYNPKSPPECTKQIRHFGAGRFPKKSQSFALSAFHLFTESKRQLDEQPIRKAI